MKFKPIKFTYVLNKNKQYKVIKDREEISVTFSEESLLNIKIYSFDFSLNNQDSLNKNNHKWSINLSNIEIPPQVFYLLQCYVQTPKVLFL